ncbi:hypothetical protein A6302_02894 [Methylobrevis pamukkalensis]|uniref:Uncharacterized protein n=1 Tax=Methylobrevis pamukkalensis TaxID=1439726 RepID=A0A1E3H0F4_9HYPH|nr:hypothetical protein A6302_02894 [Methylobrevis pamukkalensis]
MGRRNGGLRWPRPNAGAGGKSSPSNHTPRSQISTLGHHVLSVRRSHAAMRAWQNICRTGTPRAPGEPSLAAAASHPLSGNAGPSSPCASRRSIPVEMSCGRCRHISGLPLMWTAIRSVRRSGRIIDSRSRTLPRMRIQVPCLLVRSLTAIGKMLPSRLAYFASRCQPASCGRAPQSASLRPNAAAFAAFHPQRRPEAGDGRQEKVNQGPVGVYERHRRHAPTPGTQQEPCPSSRRPCARSSVPP